MKKILISIMIILSLLCVSASTIPKYKTFKFTKDMHFLTITGVINEATEDEFNKYILGNDYNYYVIYIDSPGGSVLSMANMIETMKAKDGTYICVSRLAASAAFMILQHCTYRLTNPIGSINMSHNAQGVFVGDFETITNKLKMWKGTLKQIEKDIAKRMKISHKKYKQLISSELWMNGEQARKMHAIDALVYLSCSKDLINETEERRSLACGLFGCTEKVETYSKCPLIKRPIQSEQTSSRVKIEKTK